MGSPVVPNPLKYMTLSLCIDYMICTRVRLFVFLVDTHRHGISEQTNRQVNGYNNESGHVMDISEQFQSFLYQVNHVMIEGILINVMLKS